MADPPSRKQAWKQAAAPSSASRPVEEPWRNAPVSAAPKLPWWKSRKSRIAFVTSALLVVTAVLVAVALWPRRVKPMQILLIAAGYEENLFVPHTFPGNKGL